MATKSTKTKQSKKTTSTTTKPKVSKPVEPVVEPVDVKKDDTDVVKVEIPNVEKENDTPKTKSNKKTKEKKDFWLEKNFNWNNKKLWESNPKAVEYFLLNF